MGNEMENATGAFGTLRHYLHRRPTAIGLEPPNRVQVQAPSARRH